MKVIMISGKAGHGKTTFANLLEENLSNRGTCLIMSFASLLKYICREYYDWDGKKNEDGRNLLQFVGTEVVREKDEHFWTDFVARFAKVAALDYLIIDDWRFIEEYDRMREYFDDIATVKVERFEKFVGDHPDYVNIPYCNPAMTKQQKEHRSENELDDFNCEWKVANVRLDALRETAEFMADQL